MLSPWTSLSSRPDTFVFVPALVEDGTPSHVSTWFLFVFRPSKHDVVLLGWGSLVDRLAPGVRLSAEALAKSLVEKMSGD